MRFVSTHSNVRGITAIAVSGNKKYFACVETVSDDKPQQVRSYCSIATLSIQNPPVMCHTLREKGCEVLIKVAIAPEPSSVIDSPVSMMGPTVQHSQSLLPDVW